MDNPQSPDTERDREPKPEPTRRSFLNTLLTLGGLGWLASIFYPLLRYLTPLERSGPGGPLTLDQTSLTAIQREQYTILRMGAERVIVLEQEGEMKAFSARCTHEGCTVQYVPGDDIIWCACHNGRFDMEGRVISGPPPRPLPRYRIERTADGKVIVDIENA